jgi:hypothetical protein
MQQEEKKNRVFIFDVPENCFSCEISTLITNDKEGEKIACPLLGGYVPADSVDPDCPFSDIDVLRWNEDDAFFEDS